MNTHEESLNTILQKVDDISEDLLGLLERQFTKLGIDDAEMQTALKYAIVTKMQQKIDTSKIQ